MSEVTSSQSVNGSGSPVIVEEENWYCDGEIVDNARTLELSDEEAKRLMPEPTTKAPWFGYDSFADYGDEGLDAVAEADDRSGSGWDNGAEPGPSGNGMGDIKIEAQVIIGDNTKITEDNDIVDVKDTTVTVDRGASSKDDGGSGNARSAASSGASGSGAKAGSGKTGAKK